LAYFLKFIFSCIAIKLIELYKHQVTLSAFLDLYPDFIYPELKIILSCSALVSIQYWLAVRLKNFLLPSGIGTVAAILPLAVLMILGIAGIISTPEKLNNMLKLDPYSLPYSFIFDFSQLQNKMAIVQIPTKFVMGSIITGIAAGIAGFIDIRKRNIH
jgi:hypothetical protein